LNSAVAAAFMAPQRNVNIKRVTSSRCKTAVGIGSEIFRRRCSRSLV
jgi:hypothetical protein